MTRNNDDRSYPWQKLRPVISFKLTSMLTQFYETHNKDEACLTRTWFRRVRWALAWRQEIAGERFSDVRERLASALEQFDGHASRPRLPYDLWRHRFSMAAFAFSAALRLS
jgi:hypothetical protein